jgi:pyridoxal phosphate enzyme (YggS family)
VSVAASLRTIRTNIERAGGSPDEITIVAVTKGFGVDVCRQAIDAGLTTLGENRVQEALEKMRLVPGAQWHLIGHLQTNKARAAAGHFAMIQSVDSRHLVDALAKLSGAQQVLIEVNAARDPQKTGAKPDEAEALIEHAAQVLDLRGLMAMGPAHGDPTPTFKELARIRDEAQQRLGKSLPILSMGMSGDYELAVKAGSTMLRLGTALFGPRPQ